MAKKNKGWIKLFRSITDNKIWQSKDPFDRRSAWIDILLSVNHEERTIMLRDGCLVTIGPGQMFTSTEHLAVRWKWSRGKVIRYLHLLSELGMCTATGHQYGTMLTVIKWGFFQGGRTPDGTTDDTSDSTTDGTTDGTRTRNTYNKNLYNKNELKKAPGRSSSSSFGEELE